MGADLSSRDLSPLLATLKTERPDKYLTVQAAPQAHQNALIALYAFGHEIAKIKDLVSAPMPGELRLQWWRDALVRESETNLGHPIAEALQAVIKNYQLPRAPFMALLDAHVFDLYADPFEDFAMLEGYYGETASSIFSLAHLILRGEKPSAMVADACGYAGIAYGVTQNLLQMPINLRKAQSFIPQSLLTSCGLGDAPTNPEIFFEPKHAEKLAAILAEMRSKARQYYEKASTAVHALPKEQRKAFLPLATVPPHLALLDARGYNPLQDLPRLSPLRRWYAFVRF